MEIKRDRYLNKLISIHVGWTGEGPSPASAAAESPTSSAICSALICWGRAFRQITFSPLSWI